MDGFIRISISYIKRTIYISILFDIIYLRIINKDRNKYIK